MDLDDETLELLGHGNQWEQISHKTAIRRSLVPEEEKRESLKSVEQHHADNPGSHNRAILNWKKKNPELVAAYNKKVQDGNMARFGFLVGKKCISCGMGKHTESDVKIGRFTCKNCKE